MGTEDGGSVAAKDEAVCQVDGCSLSIKWHATVINTNRPISLCEKHCAEYNQDGLIREMVSV
jgi:hypothetical protein